MAGDQMGVCDLAGGAGGGKRFIEVGLDRQLLVRLLVGREDGNIVFG